MFDRSITDFSEHYVDQYDKDCEQFAGAVSPAAWKPGHLQGVLSLVSPDYRPFAIN